MRARHSFSRSGPRARASQAGANVVRDFEGGCGQPIASRARATSSSPERGAVGSRGTRPWSGRPIRSWSAADEARPIVLRAARRDGRIHRLPVMAVHVADHVPAIRLEPRRRVVREPALHFTVDGDAVVVVEHDELAEPEGPRERARLVRDSFHEAAIAREDVGTMVHDLVPRPVEARRERALRDGHAHRVGEPLAERAGGGLHPRG